MANIKSQIKRNRQNGGRRARNRSVVSSLKTTAKKVRGASDDAAEQLRTATRQLDKAASRGVIHKRTAARRKSRLARAASA